jgi:hypothetical protein
LHPIYTPELTQRSQIAERRYQLIVTDQWHLYFIENAFQGRHFFSHLFCLLIWC